MTSAANITVRYELYAFAAEGGEKHVNRDGWGIGLTRHMSVWLSGVVALAHSGGTEARDWTFNAPVSRAF